jgi:hypothetical protein
MPSGAYVLKSVAGAILALGLGLAAWAQSPSPSQGAPNTTGESVQNLDKPEADQERPRRQSGNVRVQAPYTRVEAGRRVRVEAPYTDVKVDPDRGRVRVRAPFVDVDVRW